LPDHRHDILRGKAIAGLRIDMERAMTHHPHD
jgi:hypothetical protein